MDDISRVHQPIPPRLRMVQGRILRWNLSRSCSRLRIYMLSGRGSVHGYPLASPTHFLRLLSPITHLIPSIVQLEQVTSPSAVMWYLCITSQRTFRARHAAHAFVALLLTGLGLPLASSAAAALERFFKSGEGGAGDFEALRSLEWPPSEVMRGEARGYTCESRKTDMR
jgi:hypothetical protein